MFTDQYGPWAIVAGASDGTGAAFADELGRRGINVVLVARREPVLAEVADGLRAAHGVDTRTVVLDLSTPGAADQLAHATADLEVGFLVYNAGADDQASYFLDTPLERLEAMVRRNCDTVFRVAHHFGTGMTARGRGGLVLVTSGAAWAGGTYLAIYGATKAFNLVLAESLWAEWREQGVDVQALVLGATDTPSLRRLLEERGGSFGDLADPHEVVVEGLAHLGDGPTWAIGMPDPGASPFGALSRRDAVLMISEGAAAMHADTT